MKLSSSPAPLLSAICAATASTATIPTGAGGSSVARHRVSGCTGSWTGASAVTNAKLRALPARVTCSNVPGGARPGGRTAVRPNLRRAQRLPLQRLPAPSARCPTGPGRGQGIRDQAAIRRTRRAEHAGDKVAARDAREWIGLRGDDAHDIGTPSGLARRTGRPRGAAGRDRRNRRTSACIRRSLQPAPQHCERGLATFASFAIRSAGRDRSPAHRPVRAAQRPRRRQRPCVAD